MKTYSIASSVFAPLIILVVGGCSPFTPQQAGNLVTPLPKLTTAVVAEIRYRDSGIPLRDDQLVADAIKDKPELQRAFAGYPIKVRHDTKNAVILVCSPDGKWAWLEDASWTLGVDHEWYWSKPSHSATFTLDPAQAKVSNAKKLEPIYHAN